MNTRHSHAYERLAVEAARQAGLPAKQQTPEGAAADSGAAQIRDALWMDYERMLRDDRTYTLDDAHEWLTEQKGAVSRSSIHRDRKALLAKERGITLAAEKARVVLELAGAGGEFDVLRAGRHLAGQLLFEALSNVSADELEGMAPARVLKMVEVLAKLGKAHAETDLINQRLAAAQRAIDAAKAEADEAAGTVLSAAGVQLETINKIRAIYGLPKLEELAA